MLFLINISENETIISKGSFFYLYEISSYLKYDREPWNNNMRRHTKNQYGGTSLGGIGTVLRYKDSRHIVVQ